MALASVDRSWLALAAVAVIAAGCGDDPMVTPPPGGGGVTLRPVPGCEAIDPAPCDVFATDCQTRLMALAACLRGSAPQPLPPVSRMTEAELAQLLTAEILAEERPPDLDHYEAALVMLGLVAPGAFAPATMAATRASRVWGFYRSDLDDIVLIERGVPVDDIQANGVLLHELVHALQDREQDLSTWYEGRQETFDAALAAMSVVEGEARMEQERFGVSLLGLDPQTVDLTKHFDNSVQLAEQWVVAQPSPYLASFSAFPYEFGGRRLWPRFMQRGPQAIADLFAAPPADTRVLLDTANDAVTPPWPAPSAPVAPADWVLTQETTLGAWALYLTIARASPMDAELVAPGWRGDRLWVYGRADGAPQTVVVWSLVFADGETASRVSQRFGTRFIQRLTGANLIIAASDVAVPLDWPFGTATPARAPADGIERAAASPTGDWLNRIFLRTGCSARR